jgi:hypothetical protein
VSRCGAGRCWKSVLDDEALDVNWPEVAGARDLHLQVREGPQYAGPAAERHLDRPSTSSSRSLCPIVFCATPYFSASSRGPAASPAANVVAVMPERSAAAARSCGL